ncbi:MAG TPA: hypothetical protein EYN66_03730 [Myxococcales bacterium]|nr:hypothetical protein [Myxococcales bacterium]
MMSFQRFMLSIGWLICMGSCGAGEKKAATDTQLSDSDAASETATKDGVLSGEVEDSDLNDPADSVDSELSGEECPWNYKVKAKATGKMPGVLSEGAGIDELESAAYATLRDALLEDSHVHFVASYDVQKKYYLIVSGDGDERQEVAFTRVFKVGGGSHFEVNSGSIKSIFPQTIFQVHGSYNELLENWSNPNGVTVPEHGYIKNDPRIGFLSQEDQAYPWVLGRLASVFDAPDAPDMVVGVYPWASASVGTHGGLGLLQSRSSLILSGAGVRKGVVEESVAMLPDVAPTVLAALGASTTSGLGTDGEYSDGLYLKRQDGRVLWEALNTEDCQVPKHAIVILYDGLNANELNHLALDEDAPVDLPTFRSLATQGVVYRYGAITNFPSVSAPGHTTVGTGLWNGRHGVLSNAFFRRKSQEHINPFALLSDPTLILENPDLVLEMYDKMVVSDVENLAQAAHRAFGDWNPDDQSGAFVAVLNEITIKGADWTTLDFVAGTPPGNPMAAIAEYKLLDDLAVTQVETLLSDETVPVPKILQLSFLTTDGVGESAGPHSNELRDTLVEMDVRLKAILDAYEARGALENTLIVLTSDHGMELQDPSRNANVGAQVTSSGMKVLNSGSGMLYLRTLELVKSVDTELVSVEIRVKNHDNNDPVSNSEVICEGCVEDSVLSNEEGLAVFTYEEGADSLTFTATHTEFNPQVFNLAL